MTSDGAMTIPIDSEVQRRRSAEDAAERDARLTRTFRDFPVKPRADTARLRLDSRQLNMALGWFSVAVGVAEMIAPRTVGRIVGGAQRPWITRLAGLRQVASGVGLLSERGPTTFTLLRVAGDALDLALLGSAIRSRKTRSARALLGATLIAGVAALDIFAVQQSRRASRARAREPRKVDVRIDIDSTPEKLHAFLRNVDNLPRFIAHLQSVQVVGERVFRWVANTPEGMLIEWDAEVVDEKPGRLIAWRTLAGSAFNHHGVITFSPLDHKGGTCVHVNFEYWAPSQTIGPALAKLLGSNPEAQITNDLRRFKQLIEESGEARPSEPPSVARALFKKLMN